MISYIDTIFFIYMFIGLYMLSLLLVIYVLNRKKMFYYPHATLEAVSIVVPCYNESASIAATLDSLIALNYPKKLIEIIVVDDRSKDNSAEIVRKYTKKYKNIRLIINKRNSGGAAEPTNIGIRAAKFPYIAVTDADSTPEPDALQKMLGFLQEDPQVAAVTCSVIAKGQRKFIQRMQAIEYVAIGFGRKIFDMIDAVYVTPGPFALYRKKALIEIGLFDVKNLTQDIEIVWRLKSHGYTARMSLSAKVYSSTPESFRQWWRQRVRWNIGGTQTIVKYKKVLFKNGMLGAFIIPYFSLSLFLGIFGLGLYTYLVVRRLIVSYLLTRYSVYASAAILRFQDLTFTPSVLNFFGVVLFLLGAAYTMLVISLMDEKEVRNKNIFNLGFYLLVYLTIYPFIMIHGLYKYARGNYSW